MEYADGWRELYDLATDPHQVHNLTANWMRNRPTRSPGPWPRWPSARSSCRSAEEAPCRRRKEPPWSEIALGRAGGDFRESSVDIPRQQMAPGWCDTTGGGIAKAGDLHLSAAEERAVQMLRPLANRRASASSPCWPGRKECTAAQPVAAVGLAQSTLAEHLGGLRGAGLVQTSGEGPHRFYCLDPNAVDFLQQLTCWWGGATGPGVEGTGG